jgi:hypothetical protein
MAKNILPVAYGVIGVACLVRGFFHPHKAVVKSGQLVQCSGQNGYGTCDPSDTLKAEPGVASYAVAPGQIVAAGASFVHLLCSNEPTILMYDGITPSVQEGQHVGRGQKVGVVGSAGTVKFSVTELTRSEGALGYFARVVPPSGWLAARGAKHFAKDLGSGELWCEGGRNIQVPQSDMAACNMKRPQPGEFGLLPVQVDMG